ncbi:MAG: Ig-like domain repeat protein [Euryarchaeota archaeon]|nr:Ig-like domain repeat protein [Euryarchaeota archaeon]
MTPSVSCSTSGSTLQVTVSSGTASDTLLVATSGGAWAITFDGSAVCVGESYTTFPMITVSEVPTPATPTTFQPGTTTGLTFGGAAGSSNVLDLSGESSGLTVAVNGNSATNPGTVTGTGVSDSFSGITTVDGSSAGGTTFQPGSATGVTLVGAAGSSNVLDLSGESTGLTVAVNGDSTASPGTVTGTGLSDSFSGITTVDGSSAGGTTFQPGTATGVTFVGPAGSSNVLDLSNEPSGLTVTVNGDSTASPGTVTGTGLSDSFSGITTVDGSSVGGTTFQAGSASGILFVGQGGSSTLDLPSSASLLTVGVNGDSAASPGTLTGGGLSDNFEGVTSMVGNTGSGGATFQAGGATGLTFVGAGSGPNSLSLATETAPFTVAMNADTSTTPGSVTGSGVSDAFYGMSSVTGSPGGTTFQPGTAPSVSLIGVGSATTLDLSSEPSGLTVAVSSGSGTLSGTGISDTFSGISTFVGSSAGGTRFQPGNGAGMSFAGQGVGNTLDLSSGPSGLTVAVNGDSTTSLGTVTGTGLSDSFSAITTVDGSSAGGTTFQPGSATGLTFVGTGSGNVLDLSAEPSGLTVAMNGDSFTNLGSVTGSSLSDSFSGVTTVDGSSSGGTTFQPGTATGVTFAGAVGSTNTLDLLADPSGLTVAVNGDSSANPGTITGSSLSDSFSMVTTVNGSSVGDTTFVTGSLGGLTFSGQGTSNTLDFSGAPAGATVTLSGTPAAYSGTISGLNPGAMGSTTDTFAGIQFFVPAFSTSTSVASSLDPSSFGQAVAFTATVSPTDGGGTVTFYDGTTAICSAVTLASSGSGYQATCTTSSLGVGTRSITAQYSGDTNYAGSTSSALAQTVDKGPTGVTTAVYDATTGSPWSGTEVTGARAYDTASLSGEQLGINPTGTVTYSLYADGTCSGASLTSSTVVLSGGTVPPSGPSPPLGAGAFGFTASYPGDTNYASSTSTCEAFNVGPSPSTITLVPSPLVIDQGEVATLTATVVNQYGSSTPAPTGTVSFLANAGAGPVALGTCSLTTGSYGHCTLNTTAIPAGGYVCDDYGGDSNYQAVGYFCTSVQTVNPSLAAPGVPRVSSTQLDSSQVRGLWVNGTLPSTGTPTYSWQWLISINHGAFGPSAGICTTASGSGASAGSKVSCQFAGGYVPQQGVPYRFELNVTDSASLPESVNSAPSPLVSVAADLVPGAPTPIQPTLDAGQTVLLNAQASQGWAPYVYQWYMGPSPDCSVDSAVGGADQAALSASPSANVYYCYGVSDSANVSESGLSATDLVLVDPALGPASLSTSRSALDVGQLVLLSVSTSGGSGVYHYGWAGLPRGCATADTAQLTCYPSAAGAFSVRAWTNDTNGASVSATLWLTVSADPTITTPTTPRMDLDVGQSTPLSFLATNGTGLWSILAWAGLPSGCGSVNGTTLTCAPGVAGTYSVSASITDSNGMTASSGSVTLIVSPALVTPSIAASRTTLDVGQSVLLSASVSGGTGSYTYTWGPLPAGCTAFHAASLTCTPTSVGAGSFATTVMVTDGNGASLTSPSTTLTVSADPTVSAPSSTRMSLDLGQVAVLSATATNGTGLPSSYAWAGLPTGCPSADAPALTCVPSGTGTYLVTVSIQDSNGMGVSSAPLTLIVSSRMGSLDLSSSVAALDVGQSVALSVAVAGGAAPYTYIWNVASFPTQGCRGLGAVLTCTAALAGPATVMVTVTDSNGVNLTSSALKLTVSARLIPGSIALDPATLDLGQATKLAASVAGGSGGLTYAWSGLPSGCSASSSVNLTCTPSVSGTSWVMVAVTDSNEATVVDGPVSLVVSPTLGTVSVSVSATTLEVGGVVSFTASVVGGTAPFVYSWSGLPTGCTTFDTPTMTCEPTATGVYSVSVKVTDATGASVTSSAQSVTVTKAPAPAATGLSNGLDWSILALALVALVIGLMGMFLALRSKGPRTAAKEKEASREERGSDLKEGAKPTSEAPETSREGEAGAEAESRGEMSER